MSDILFQSLLFWAFYFSYFLCVEPSFKNSIYSVVFFVLAMLTKPIAFLLGFTIGIVLLVSLFKKKAIHYLIPFLFLPITYHVYCKYNEQVTGYYHYSSVTPVFVLKYMAKYTNAQLHGENFADSVQEVRMKIINQQGVFASRYQMMNDAGKEIIFAHKAFFIWFNIKAWFAFMLDPGRFEWAHFLNLDEGSFLGLYHVIHTQGFIKGLWFFISHAPLFLLFILAITFLWNLLMSVALVLFFFSKRISATLRFWAFLFMGYIIGSTGVLGLSRYRVAVAPFIWLAALFILFHLVERYQRKRL